MKRLIGAVAATALLVCPLAATAQMHDGGGHRDGAVANWRGDGHQGQDGVRMGAGRMGASPWRGERTFGAHADGGRDWRAARFSGGGRWDGNAQRSFGHRGGYYDGRLRQGREEEGFGVRRGDDGFRRDRDDRGFGFGRERDEDGFGFGGSPWIYSYPDDSDYYAPFYDDGSGWGYGVGAPAQDWTDYGVAQEDGGYGPAREQAWSYYGAPQEDGGYGPAREQAWADYEAPPQGGGYRFGMRSQLDWSAGAPPADCGQWVWFGEAGRYHWVPASCERPPCGCDGEDR